MLVSGSMEWKMELWKDMKKSLEPTGGATNTKSLLKNGPMVS